VQALKNVRFKLAKASFWRCWAVGLRQNTLLTSLPGFLARLTPGHPERQRSPDPGADVAWFFQQARCVEWMSVQPQHPRSDRIMAATGIRNAPLLKICSHGRSADFGDKIDLRIWSGRASTEPRGCRDVLPTIRCHLMDDRSGALDALTARRCRAGASKLWKETQDQFILITHSVEEATASGRDCLLMAPRPAEYTRIYCVRRESRRPRLRLGQRRNPNSTSPEDILA